MTAAQPRLFAEPAERTVVSPELRFHFEQSHGKNGVPYYLQGDLRHYTPRSMAKRRELRAHPLVLAALERFWSVYRKDSDGNIPREEYEHVHLKMGKLLHECFDAQRARCLKWRTCGQTPPSRSTPPRFSTASSCASHSLDRDRWRPHRVLWLRQWYPLWCRRALPLREMARRSQPVLFLQRRSPYRLRRRRPTTLRPPKRARVLGRRLLLPTC